MKNQISKPGETNADHNMVFRRGSIIRKFQHLLGDRRLRLTVITLAGFGLASGCSTHHEAKYESPPTASAGGTDVQYQSAKQETVKQETVKQEQFEGQQRVVVPLHEESVTIGKREVDAGSVRLKKIVKTEIVNQPIELRHEELVIDREGGTGEQAQKKILAQPFQEEEMIIRLTREEPVIQKQMTPRGQIVIQTRSATEQRNVQTEARKEDIDVAKLGNPSNVTINLQGSAQGAASTPGGIITGTGSSTTTYITDPRVLCATADRTALYGRAVRFEGMVVRDAPANRVIVLDCDERPLYVYSPRDLAPIKPGDRVTLTGTIREIGGFESKLTLSGKAQQVLSSQPFYIEVDRLDTGSQPPEYRAPAKPESKETIND